MADNAEKDIQGGCYCGEVRFTIPEGTRPVVAGYCHCIDCRQAHAASMYQFVYVLENEFRITHGVAHLNWYTRSAAVRENVQRYFCANCGTRVYNAVKTKFDGELLSLAGTFPSLFDDQLLARNEVWAPQSHTNCEQSLINLSQLDDGLPRHPKALGAT